jgi:hypothetical protein
LIHYTWYWRLGHLLYIGTAADVHHPIMPKVQVKVGGVWKRATPNQALAFARRKPGDAVKTGNWTVVGSPGRWDIFSTTERYRIRTYVPPRPRFADLAASPPASNVWARDRADRFMDRVAQKSPTVDIEPYRAAVVNYLTGKLSRLTPPDYGKVAFIGEHTFAETEGVQIGIWANGIRFANNNWDNYRHRRDLAMQLFSEAEHAL